MAVTAGLPSSASAPTLGDQTLLDEDFTEWKPKIPPTVVLFVMQHVNLQVKLQLTSLIMTHQGKRTEMK